MGSWPEFFLTPTPFYPGSGSGTLWPHSAVRLIHNRAVLLGQTKSFNMNMSVKTIEQLSNKMFEDIVLLC